MSDMEQLVERSKQVLMSNYARLPIVMTRGEGTALWDDSGKRYLDLFAGFGGAILGHCHPALVAAATEQAHKLWHVGNQFYTEPQMELGERLNRHAFQGQAFFCHSGAEANEAAVKLARLRGSASNPKRWKIISLNKSFHGRTLAMITATGNPAVKAGFEPLVPGFVQVEGGDYDALAAAIDDETAGILVEPIQGEGGINEYPSDYLPKLRKLCDERGLTLIFDEVWTGCGRTGRWFAHQGCGEGSGFGVQGSREGSGFRVQGSGAEKTETEEKTRTGTVSSSRNPEPSPEPIRDPGHHDPRQGRRGGAAGGGDACQAPCRQAVWSGKTWVHAGRKSDLYERLQDPLRRDRAGQPVGTRHEAWPARDRSAAE